MERTISLLLIIGLGLILKTKIKSQDHLKGLKVLILSVALPATIFAALLNVQADAGMLMLPVLGLLVNLVWLGAFHFSLKGIGQITDDRRRTLLVLMPSLAPGLSCFPFISEYLGGDALAMAALADVGNKVFVLIILYMVAMNWYYRRSENQSNAKGNRLKELLLSLVKEPINMVIVVALVLLSFGINMDALPGTISSLILRLSTLMAPLVLLFIGMAVKIRRNDLGLILRMLSLRSGMAFLLCSILILILPNLTSVLILLLLVFAQSSASFWPFAHISLVNELEKDQDRKTFDNDLALSILALSLPFSTFVILCVLSFPDISGSPVYPAVTGVVLVLIFLIKPLRQFIDNAKPTTDREVSTGATSSSIG